MSIPLDPGRMSPGTQVNRMLDQLGFSDVQSAMIGAALDAKVGNAPGVMRNLMDAFSPMSTRQMDRLLAGGFSQPGFCERPHQNFPHNFASFGNTHYTREKLFQGTFQNMIQGPAAERQLMAPGNEAMRAAFEQKLGGRIVPEFPPNYDGKITVARQQHHPLIPFQNQIQKNIGSLLNRCFQPPKLNEVLQNLGNFLQNLGGIKFPTNIGGINLGGINIGGINIGGGAGGATGPGGAGQPGGGSSVGEPGDILKNPNLSFEEKLFLFMLAFCEKKQKEIEQKMADMEAKQKGGDKAGGGGGGGKGGGLGGMLGGLGQMGGGLAGGLFGGPIGAGLGSQIGGMAGGALGSMFGGGGGGAEGAGGAGGAGGSKGSEQTDQAILQNEMQKLQKMFESVNQVLKIFADSALSSIQKMKLQG